MSKENENQMSEYQVPEYDLDAEIMKDIAAPALEDRKADASNDKEENTNPLKNSSGISKKKRKHYIEDDLLSESNSAIGSTARKGIGVAIGLLAIGSVLSIAFPPLAGIALMVKIASIIPLLIAGGNIYSSTLKAKEVELPFQKAMRKSSKEVKETKKNEKARENGELPTKSSSSKATVETKKQKQNSKAK